MPHWKLRETETVARYCSGWKGGAEIASIKKDKYGKSKYKPGHFTSMKNASMEKASTDLYAWNTQVRKTQVRI